MTTKRLVLFILIAAAASGCSRNEKAAAPPQQVQAGEVKVAIVPATPTAANDLLVQVSCAGNRSIAWERNDSLLEGQKETVLPHGLLSKGDRIKAAVSCDGKAGSVVLQIANSVPEVTGVTVVPDRICRGTDITATPVARDGDGDPISYQYRWLVNGAEASASNLLPGTSFARGDRIAVEVVPSDGQQGKTFRSRDLVIPDCPPAFISSPPVAFTGERVTYPAKAVDPDGEAVAYSVDPAVSGVTMDAATGLLTVRLREVAAPATIRIVATDRAGSSAYQEFSIPRVGEAKE